MGDSVIEVELDGLFGGQEASELDENGKKWEEVGGSGGKDMYGKKLEDGGVRKEVGPW